MAKKASESFETGVDTPDEAFVEEDGESIEDIAPETIRNATTTRRRIEDYLEERRIKRLTDDFDFDRELPRPKRGGR